MLQLGSALASGVASAVFKTNFSGKVWIRIGGTPASVAMTQSLDNSTFAALGTGLGGTAVTFTAASVHMLELPAGLYFKLTDTGGSGTDIHVSGEGISLVD